MVGLLDDFALADLLLPDFTLLGGIVNDSLVGLLDNFAFDDLLVTELILEGIVDAEMF
jgi:hypothetical protein